MVEQKPAAMNANTQKLLFAELDKLDAKLQERAQLAHEQQQALKKLDNEITAIQGRVNMARSMANG